jgi:putative inorganic carbon (HCO3(-)) transporter
MTVAAVAAVSLTFAAVIGFGSDQPLAITAFFATIGLVAVVVLALTHFELLTYWMIAARTAIDLTHPGADDQALRFSVWITGAYTAVSVLWLVVRRSERLRISPLCIGVVGVASAAILSGLLSDERAKALIGASRWVFLTVLVLVLDNLIKDQQAVRRLLLAVGASTVVPVLIGMWQLIAERDRLVEGIFRIEGSFAHPNTYGFYLVIVGLTLVALIRSLPGGYRPTSRVLLILIIISLVYTFSRTSYAAFAVGVVVIAMVGRRWLLLGLTVLTISVAPLIPTIGERLADLGEGTTLRGTPGNSFTWRVDYWQTVIDAGEGRRVTGVGLGVVSEITESGREPHNDFIRSFVELGAIGLTAYIGFLLLMGWQARKALAETRSALATTPPNFPRCLAEGFAGIFAAYMIESITGNPMTQLILLWYVVAIAVAARSVGLSSPAVSADLSLELSAAEGRKRG